MTGEAIKEVAGVITGFLALVAGVLSFLTARYGWLIKQAELARTATEGGESHARPSARTEPLLYTVAAILLAIALYQGFVALQQYLHSKGYFAVQLTRGVVLTIPQSRTRVHVPLGYTAVLKVTLGKVTLISPIENVDCSSSLLFVTGSEGEPSLISACDPGGARLQVLNVFEKTNSAPQ